MALILITTDVNYSLEKKGGGRGSFVGRSQDYILLWNKFKISMEYYSEMADAGHLQTSWKNFSVEVPVAVV